MPSIQPLLDHVAPYLLVVVRLSGLFIFAPMLSSRMIPARVRAMLTVMFAAAIYPALPSSLQTPPDADLFSLLPMVFTELLIGLSIGLIASLPLMGMELAGMIMGHQMGMSIARAYNPEADTDSEVLGQLSYYLGLGAFIAMGGIDGLYLCILRSFGRIPVGGLDVGKVPLDTFVGVLSSGFELALRVSAPVVCAIFLVMIAIGFVMKTMPQINVMSVGFAIKILCGLVALGAGVAVLDQVAGEEVGRVLRVILDWAGG
jgi:flagellar biosynthetic protein FliR